MGLNKTVLQMAILRILFGSLGILFALLMLKFNNLKMALKLNGILGSIGPFIFIGVTALGLFEAANKIPPAKLIMIIIGTIFILIGTR
jgi:hypothetical protein